ncbi:MAG: hypothetical protein M3O15_08015 [Acidobacteriota bacterium]|nr:hypothetical protein [Acidobacteriota bacterium]
MTFLLIGIGILGANLPAAADQPGAPDSTKELKAGVEALDRDIKALEGSLQHDALGNLDQDVKDLRTSLQRYAPAQANQPLEASLRCAAVIAMIVAAFLLASAILLWLTTRKLAGLASLENVNAARDTLRTDVVAAVNAARDVLRNDILNAVTAARDQVHTDVAGARGDVILAVNNARDMAHNDVSGAVQAVNAARDGLQASVAGARDAARSDVSDLRSSVRDALDDIKARISALPH